MWADIWLDIEEPDCELHIFQTEENELKCDDEVISWHTTFAKDINRTAKRKSRIGGACLRITRRQCRESTLVDNHNNAATTREVPPSLSETEASSQV